MKTYKIKVNGKEYLVEAEEVKESENLSSLSSSNKTETTSNSKADAIDAPMQGTLLSVEVNEGDSVTKGQIIAVLEAMKLENEIVSPFDGIVEKILVQSGDTVDNGTPLMTVLSR